MVRDPKTRFSTRVENYLKYRPGYPPQVISLLKHQCSLMPHSIIADVGSGTGILSELFLQLGCTVFGIEPNREMREAGNKQLAQYEAFRSVDGSAEETHLQKGSVDFVTAGQSFHWFDRSRSKSEFVRILKPGGWVVLVWNQRKENGTPFLQGYEELLQLYATDYRVVDHRHVDLDMITRFYGDGNFKMARFNNHQELDYESLKGRLLSSSYTPEPGEHGYGPLMLKLHDLFARNNQNGFVRMQYDTTVYFGRLS